MLYPIESDDKLSDDNISDETRAYKEQICILKVEIAQKDIEILRLKKRNSILRRLVKSKNVMILRLREKITTSNLSDKSLQCFVATSTRLSINIFNNAIFP